MFRNAVEVVAPVAEVNNYLLPLWMIVFGLQLLNTRKRASPVLQPSPVAA
jgi:hypothetical protein